VQQLNKTFKKGVEDLGMKFSSADAAFDSAKEQEIMDLAIARNFDVISVNTVDPLAVGPRVTAARKKGILLLGWCCDMLSRPTIANVRPFYREGKIAAQWLAKRLEPGAPTIAFVGNYLVSAGLMRIAGYVDECKKNGLRVLAAEEGSGWSQEGGYALGNGFLARFKDIKGVWTGDDQGGLGFSKAARDAGRREEMLIIGVDGLREGQEGVADGRLDMSMMPEKGHGPESARAIEQMAALLRGGVHGDAFEMMHVVNKIVVTKDTIAQQWPSPI